MYLTEGTLLQGGKYKIVRHISSGGFGNTYEGYDVSLDKKVAIKEFFVKDFCTRDSDTTLVTITASSKGPLIKHLKQKFIDEARAIAKMEHDNIIKVHTLFEENGTAYYVMDYIEGESVSDLLKRRGSLPEKEAVAIILKVASALDYMHKQNRYHLDVKPANIMLRKDGKVVLIDFGSSKQYVEVEGENTTTLAPCYTAGFAPAEQMNPKPTTFTAATDVYALGATLYKMLTGVTPPSAIDLLNGEETLQTLSNDISENVRECIEKAMIPQRNKRMQSVDVFFEALRITSNTEGKSTIVCSSQTDSNDDNVYGVLSMLGTIIFFIMTIYCMLDKNTVMMWISVFDFIFCIFIFDVFFWGSPTIFGLKENHHKQLCVVTLVVEAIMILTLAITYFSCRPNAKKNETSAPVLNESVINSNSIGINPDAKQTTPPTPESSNRNKPVPTPESSNRNKPVPTAESTPSNKPATTNSIKENPSNRNSLMH